MIPLTTCRNDYRCVGCDRTILKGESCINLGHGYRSDSRGRVCKYCILETADNIRKEVVI